MSRKVSMLAAHAVRTNGAYSNGKNTKVAGGWLFLHGNHIARNAGEGRVAITNKGWFTLTTKDRLNALDNVSIVQKRGEWFLNGHRWNGDWVIVAPDRSWVHEVDINCDAAWRR